MTLFSARDESLPSVGDAVRDISNGLRVVVVVGQESLSPLPDVDSAGEGFLKEETIKLSWRIIERYSFLPRRDILI